MKTLLKYSLGLLVACATVSAYAVDVTGDRLDIGTGNTLSGTGATIAGGANNEVSANYSAVLSGEGNTNTGPWSVIAGGDHNFMGSGGGGMFIGGGVQNTNDGDYTFIGGGYKNSIYGYTAGVIAGGELNTMENSYYSFIGAGYDNLISSDYNSGMTIAGGIGNSASRSLATIPGGGNASASHYGQFAYASGAFANTGDAQTSIYVSRNSTTNSTQTDLFLDGGTSSERMTLSSGSSWTFDILIVGRNSTGDSAHYQVVGGIENVSGTTALVGTPIKTVLGEDVSGWDVTVSADDTNDALRIQVTGDSSTIRWVATVRTVEVKN